MSPALWSSLAQSQGGNLDLAFTIDKIARTPISQIVLFALVLTAVRLLLFFYLKNTPVHKRSGGYGFAKFLNDVSDALVYAAVVVFLLVRPFGIQTFFIPSQSMVDTLRIGDFIVANKFIYRASEPQPGDIVVFKPPKIAQQPGMEDSDFIKRLIGGPGDVVTFDKFQLNRNDKPVEEPYKVLTDPYNPAPPYNNTVPFTGDRLQEVVQAWDFNNVRLPANFKLVEYQGKVVPMFYDNYPGQPVQATILASTSESATLIGTEALELINQEPKPIPEGYYMMVGDNRNGSNDSRFWGLVPRDSIIGKAEFIWLPIRNAKKLVNSQGLPKSE